MPTSEYRDSQGRNFAEYTADQVMAAIAASGKSVLAVSRESGINRETLRDRIHNVYAFNTVELARVAQALDMSPADLIRADDFNPI